MSTTTWRSLTLRVLAALALSLAVAAGTAVTTIRLSAGRVEATVAAAEDAADQARMAAEGNAAILAGLSGQGSDLAGIARDLAAAIAAVRDCTTDDGSCARRLRSEQAAQTAAILAGIDGAIERLAALSVANRTQATQIAALLAEVARLRGDLARMAPTSPTPTTLPPPSGTLCGLLGPLGTTIGCR